MGYLSTRQLSSDYPNGYVHLIVPDNTATTGYRSYKFKIADILDAAQLLSEKDEANGYPGLDANKKINPIQLPAIAITNTYIVVSEAEMLALSVTVGSVAVRTDESKSYILQSEPSSVLGNWIELQGVSGVASFNARTGTVTPQNGDYTTDQITETATNVFLTPALLQKLIDITGTDLTAFHTDANAEISGLTDISTINDASVFLAEKTGVFNKVKVAWSLIKSTLKTYFDTIYAAINHNHDTDYEPIRTTDQNYVTDVQLGNIQNLSGVNTGNQYSDQDTILGSGSLADPFYVSPTAIGGTASNVTVDTTNFDNNLSAADDTVQKALDTIDDLVIAGTDSNAIHVNASSEISGLTEKSLIVDNDIYLAENSENTNSKIKVKWSSIKSVLKTYFDGLYQAAGTYGDMLLASVQSVTGLKTFDKDKIAMKGTSTGKTVISTANTSANDFTQTLQDRSGVLALIDDIASGAVEELGEIINEQFANIANWTNVGSASFAASSNQLTISGGNNTAGNYLRYDGYGVSNLEGWLLEMDVIPGTASVSSYGIGINIKSVRGDWDNIIKVDLTTTNFGKISFTTSMNGAETKTSLQGLIASTNTFKLVVQFIKDTYFITFKDTVTGYTSALEYNIGISYPFISIYANSFKWCIIAYGGSNIVDNFKVTGKDLKKSELLTVGDSICYGVGVDNIINRFTDILRNNYNIFSQVNAGPGNYITDLNASEIIALQPVRILIMCGINDIRNPGLSASDVRTRMNNLTNTLISAGYTLNSTLFIGLLMPASGGDISKITALNNYFITDYGDACIDFFTEANASGSFSTLYSLDGTHPNVEFHYIIADLISNKLKLIHKKERKGFSKQITYAPNGNMLIASKKFRGATPNHQLEILNEIVPILRLGKSQTGGYGYIFSVDGTSLWFGGGCYFDGTNFIATNASPSFFAIYQNQLRFYSDTGKTVGSAYTPTERWRLEIGKNYFGGSGVGTAGSNHFPIGQYTYFSNTTGDAIGDYRVFYSGGIQYTEYCTVANATKGGGTWVRYKLIDASGNTVLPKTSGIGIKVDTVTPTFGWKDLIGNITIKGTPGATTPTWAVYRAGIYQYQFGVNDECWLEFHLPHDYVPGTDIFIHAHWSVIVNTVTSGGVTWSFETTYAKGHDQDNFIAPVTASVTQAANAANEQYRHMIAEVQLSAASPSANQIDSDNLEVDGLILVRCYLSANDMNGTPEPFLHFVDIHYQSTQLATKNKAPNFYA